VSAIRLSDTTVAAASCPAGRRDVLIFDAALRGFGVRITAGGARVFLYQYRVGAKVRRQRLGEWPGLTTPQARRLAETLRGTVNAGGDPVAARRTEREATMAREEGVRQQRAANALTVAVVVEQWRTTHLATRRPSYQASASARLRTALASHLDAPAATLTRALALEAVDKALRDAGPIAANRVRAYARACFGWAHARGMLPGNPFAAVPKPAQERSRDRVLGDAELARIWQASERLGSPWQAIVRLLILTGQRRSEVAGMRWAEVALEPAAQALWAMPGARTKNGHSHDVPLSAPAVAIVAAAPYFKGCPLALSDGRPNPPSGFGKAKARLDALLVPPLPAWTLHDLRRTVATGLQRHGVRLEVTEAVLNHVSGSRGGIVGVYQRHAWAAEKRAALDAWAVHVAGLK
jgi:integrase